MALEPGLWDSEVVGLMLDARDDGSDEGVAVDIVENVEGICETDVAEVEATWDV